MIPRSHAPAWECIHKPRQVNSLKIGCSVMDSRLRGNDGEIFGNGGETFAGMVGTHDCVVIDLSLSFPRRRESIKARQS